MSTKDIRANGETETKTTTLPSFDASFWLELAIKQGIPGAIALYLVWAMAGRVESKLDLLNSNIVQLRLELAAKK